MALPPIITNLPFLKLFRTEQETSQPVKESLPADIVEISEAASARFESIKSLSPSNLGELQEILHDTRTTLEENSVSLGLQPGFE